MLDFGRSRRLVDRMPMDGIKMGSCRGGVRLLAPRGAQRYAVHRHQVGHLVLEPEIKHQSTIKQLRAAP
jgi:hypothetical protein